MATSDGPTTTAVTTTTAAMSDGASTGSDATSTSTAASTGPAMGTDASTDADATTTTPGDVSGPVASATSVSGTSNGDTEPTPDGPAGPCPSGNNDECVEGYCLAFTDGADIVASVCGAPGCGDDQDCQDFVTNGTPVCNLQVPRPTCVLACGRTIGDCPAGMECFDTAFGLLCAWPV